MDERTADHCHAPRGPPSPKHTHSQCLLFNTPLSPSLCYHLEGLHQPQRLINTVQVVVVVTRQQP